MITEEQDLELIFPEIFGEGGDVKMSGLDPTYNLKKDIDEPTLSFPCVVIDRIYPDSEESIRKQYIEYHVISSQGAILRNLTFSGDADGYESGETITLTPATKTIDGSVFNIQTTPFEKMNGDWVLVEPVLGKASRLHIVARLPHPASTFRPIEDDGDVRWIEHKGTRFSFDKDGNVTIDTSAIEKNITFKSKDTTITLSSDTITIDNNNNSIITIEGSKTTHISPQIDLKGSGSGVTSALTTEALMDLLKYFFTNVAVSYATTPQFAAMAATVMPAIFAALGIPPAPIAVPPSPGTKYVTTVAKAE